MEKIKVSYAKTVYGKKEIDAINKCLTESTQMGHYARKFESQIAKLFDKKYGLYVNSGSSALYLGMEASRFPKGGEVITPALTFSTTVGSIVKSNLIPIFVDVGENDYCIDVNTIEKNITTKTVAIVAPNLMGNICDWKTISDIAKKYNLKVIEDSADTLGGKLNGKLSGAYCDWSITSFYGSHIINCAGNGGMLCIDDDELMNEAKLLRSWGRSSSIFDERSEEIENRFNVDVDSIPYDAKFIFEKIGYNLEGSEIGAAFGLAQLESLENNIKLRESNFVEQTKFFEKYSDFIITPLQTKNSESAWLAYPIIIKESAPFKRRDFQIYLEKSNIQTRTVFTGNITRQPGFKNIEMRICKNGLKNSDNVMKGGVLLACHHGLTKDMFSHMHGVCEKFLKQYI
ncbi:MAG: aminotransferase class I/II-fold pyridoxal phosphate-dependent enzyme [Pseudomonadota bacterium]|nr:aminotransferase class I/II-fold pyridoxal phosphate-dependent enzyme [Pseudomonadota bacterium]